MGTKANICIKMHDERVIQTKINWDGYLSHTGKILLEHYQDTDKVFDLINGGEISFMEKLEEGAIEVVYYGDSDYYPTDHYPIETKLYADEYYNYIFDVVTKKWRANFVHYDEEIDIASIIHMELGDALDKYGSDH